MEYMQMKYVIWWKKIKTSYLFREGMQESLKLMDPESKCVSMVRVAFSNRSCNPAD